MKKVIAMLLVLMIGLTAISCAMADEGAEESAPAPVVEVKKEEPAPAPVPVVSEVKEEAEETPAAPAEVVSEEAENEIIEENATEEPVVENEITEENITEEETAEEATEEAVEEEAEAEESSVSVKLELKNKGTIEMGDKITIQAKVEGLEGGYSISWECNKADGKGWEEIKGASGDEYSFYLTEETVAYSYRALVSIG